MTDLDRVIHEPARLLIVALLAGVREADFLWVLRESALTKGNLSSHLAKLEEAGYVEVEKTYKGKIPLTMLRLSRQGKAPFDRYKKTLAGVLERTTGTDGLARSARVGRADVPGSRYTSVNP